LRPHSSVTVSTRPGNERMMASHVAVPCIPWGKCAQDRRRTSTAQNVTNLAAKWSHGFSQLIFAFFFRGPSMCSKGVKITKLSLSLLHTEGPQKKLGHGGRPDGFRASEAALGFDAGLTRPGVNSPSYFPDAPHGRRRGRCRLCLRVCGHAPEAPARSPGQLSRASPGCRPFHEDRRVLWHLHRQHGGRRHSGMMFHHLSVSRTAAAGCLCVV